jgi:CDP-glycerol glycerophosphotransferase
VGNPELGRGRHPRRALIAPDELAIPAYAGKMLTITVRRVVALLESVTSEGDAVRFTLRAAGGSLDDTALFLRRTDALRAQIVPLTVTGDRAHAVVSADVLQVRSSSLGDREWVLGVADPQQQPTDPPRSLLDMAPEMEDTYLTLRQRSLAVCQDDPGTGATLRDSRPGPVLTEFAWEPHGLRLRGVANGSDLEALTIANGSGTRHVLRVHRDGDVWSALLPSTGEPGSAVLRWLQPGRWFWSVATDDDAQRNRPVRVMSTAEIHLGETGEVGGLSFRLRSNSRHELQMVVDASGDLRERGALHRERSRRYWYRLQRRLPLEETIFFESWKGRQYSDNPRAIYEELIRQGDRRRMVWAVDNLSVEVPEGAERVLTGGRSYYRHLARARWVVSNDSMPNHYVKRPGTRYAQTWHGTPLKRIGFHIDNLQMSNQQYLVQFGRDVAKWDTLVSPNPFSTDVLASAFRYGGEILEIGYPRNDIFHRPELAASRVETARRRLNLPHGKRVILYAPTWRDNDYNSHGRYQFTMKLDLERLHRAFGQDSVLLIRGHHLVASAIDAAMFGGFVRNVSDFPDITDLYLVADVLVTDYSSVMFDFVNTGRPMLFFTWDLEDYRDNLRGFYFDFEQDAPGPLLTTSSDVIEALRSLDDVTRQYAARYQAFRERFAGLEDGKASARFIERFL